ncbi:MAG: tyrosine-type recombinase/integrase [Ferruginibacter sp.]
MTIHESAIQQVTGYEDFYQRLIRKMEINGLATSTQKNYSRSLASMAIHFKQLPITLSQDQLEEYLYKLRKASAGSSFNSFKFAICALQFVFRNFDLPGYTIKLPPVKQRRKLPVVLSRQEITALMNVSSHLKQRVMIALLYGCGLRCGELRNLKLADVDLDRSMLFIRQAKGKKDRYIPLGNTLTNILAKYIRIEKPGEWLFTGKNKRGPLPARHAFASSIRQRSIQSLIKQTARKAGIVKNINVHSLRHTYATHLLEDGVDILTIRELLGHAHISTTLVYLHVAQVTEQPLHSPLDKLSGLKIIGYVQTAFSFGE